MWMGGVGDQPARSGRAFSLRTMDRDQNRGDEGVRTTTRIGMNERIATRAVLTAVVLLALAATALVAQRAPSQLTLEEAITLAKGNNPLYLRDPERHGCGQLADARGICRVLAHGQREWLGVLSGGGRCSVVGRTRLRVAPMDRVGLTAAPVPAIATRDSRRPESAHPRSSRPSWADPSRGSR